MATHEQYMAALHGFCADLSQKIVQLATGDAEAAPDLGAVADVHQVIRETIANLLLCEYECERVLNRG